MPNRLRFTLELKRIRPMISSSLCTQPRYFHALDILHMNEAYLFQVNDNPATKELARRAVELIAQSRKSEGLKYFLKTGEAGTSGMDVADAYRLLQIPDRTIDDGAIMAAYTICVDEAPAQAEKYNQALSLIAQEKNSSLLGSMVPGFSAQPDRDLSEWPVGLQNIGNTCYLNSLLQFYFSVRPFREMVLDFESFKMEFDIEDIAKKQVGSRKVHKQEVERSQRCKSSHLFLHLRLQNTDNSPSPQRITHSFQRHDYLPWLICYSWTRVGTIDLDKSF